MLKICKQNKTKKLVDSKHETAKIKIQLFWIPSPKQSPYIANCTISDCRFHRITTVIKHILPH